MMELTREQQLIILGLIVMLMAGLGVMVYRRTAGQPNELFISEPASQESEISAQIVVHVSGAVVSEGVYKLKLGDRVLDVIEAAGGSLAGADLSSLNLAEKVKDGQKIIIPVKVRVSENQSIRTGISENQNSRGAEKSSVKVNLNSANEQYLRQIKGVGPAMAKRILDYRQDNGPFTKIDDLMKVKGIGEGKFKKMKEQVTL